MEILKLNPGEIKRWQFADRDIREFGNIKALAEDIKTNGQIEPVIVRPCLGDNQFKYELVAGSRRWKACLDANIDILATVRDLDDQEALTCQLKENEKKPLSDYSKGMNYKKIIDKGLMKKRALAKKLGIAESSMQNYMAFSRISEDILNAIGRLDRVSASAAYMILKLSQKGKDYRNALLEIAKNIECGIGGVTIEKNVKRIVQQSTGVEVESKDFIFGADDKVVASWKKKHLVFDKSIDVSVHQEKLNKIIADYFVQVANEEIDSEE